jgi:hypothetical protein
MHRLLSALLLLACNDPAPCDDCVDAGRMTDAGMMEEVDAGMDAGPERMCPPGPVAPDEYDCDTNTPPAVGEPITADPMTWTFIPFADSRCANGTATGIGININPNSTRLVIYLEGGGACFDTLSCAGSPQRFGATEFAAYGDALDGGLFDRDDASNPLRDHSFVFVPYCTGDVHGGSTMDGFGGRDQVGYLNMTAFLRRIVPTFPNATDVLLTGRSAGGLGALVNFSQVQEAFDCVPVDAFDDGGAVLGDEYMRPCLQSLVRGLWGFDANVPEDCAQCTCSDGGGLVNVYPYLARRFPDSRFGLATSMGDATFRTFYGYGYSRFCNVPEEMPAEDFAAGLGDVRTLMSDDENFHTFYVPGEQHTFSYQPLSSTQVGGTSLAAWLTHLVDDDAAWTDVGP